MTLTPLMYVDDLSKTCSDAQESKKMGQVITESLRKLKMQAHPDKSCLLVFGKNKEKLKESIEATPTQIQDFDMKFSTCETYLGMQFSSGGASDSITQTLLSRKVKCMTKSIDLKNKLEDDRVQSLGWLVTAVNVFQAVIVSTLLYGCGSWINLTKAQEELIEAIQRHCLTTVLDITPKCSYRTLLHVTGILPAMDIVNKTKVTFINDLFHIKGSGICRDLLIQERSLNRVRGLLMEVSELCEANGFEDVTETYVRPDHIKERIEGKSKCRTLAESLCSRSAPYHYLQKTKKQRNYFTYSKDKAKLALAYDVGCLNLRANRRAESFKKYGSVSCLVPGCTGTDDLEHIMYNCQGYKVKIVDKGISDDFIDCLTELNRQRIAKFGTSMINWSS